MVNINELLLQDPVVAAVRNYSDMEKAINSKVKIIFVLFGNIININEICNSLKSVNKIIFIHIDMIEGLKGDVAGIKYIREVVKPDGIITTKGFNIKYAKSVGMLVIQRLFIVDSMSLKTGIKNINEYKPDAVEIMPGIASKIIETLKGKTNALLIAGGLLNTKKEAMNALSSGAIAISTSCSELWDI